MNPAFYILIILGVIALWTSLSFIFPVVGQIIYKAGKDTYDIMNEEDEEEKEKE